MSNFLNSFDRGGLIWKEAFSKVALVRRIYLKVAKLLTQKIKKVNFIKNLLDEIALNFINALKCKKYREEVVFFQSMTP